MEIIRVDEENYHLFDDMIFWRINGRERDEKEKLKVEVSDEVWKELANPNLYIYSVLIAGKMVGWMSLIYMPKVGKFNGRGHIYIDELWVEPLFRGRGFGKKLMKKADELLKELNGIGIRLYVSQDNESAIACYETCGYTYSGKTYFMEK